MKFLSLALNWHFGYCNILVYLLWIASIRKANTRLTSFSQRTRGVDVHEHKLKRIYKMHARSFCVAHRMRFATKLFVASTCFRWLNWKSHLIFAAIQLGRHYIAVASAFPLRCSDRPPLQDGYHARRTIQPLRTANYDFVILNLLFSFRSFPDISAVILYSRKREH